MNKIVKIVPTEDCFRISWIIHLKCNYDCMYCPPERHTDQNDMLSLEQLQSHWTQIYEKTQHKNLPYKLNFSGGEVTVNRNLLPFIQWLDENYGQHIKFVVVSTNGSASQNYYLSLFKHVHMIAFSTHTEQIDDDKFWPTAVSCAEYARNNNKSFMVNIMDEFWAEERTQQYEKFCQDYQIDYARKKIDYKIQTRTIPIFRNELTHP